MFVEGKNNKGADTDMAYMMAKTLYKDLKDRDERNKAVFIIAAGDRDYKFQVDDVLENDVKVQLWLFKHGTTEEDGKLERHTYSEEHFYAKCSRSSQPPNNT